jgi:hypothetical protein
MRLTTAWIPVPGSLSTTDDELSPVAAHPEDDNQFGQLVALYNDNARLGDDLERTRRAASRLREYIDTGSCNPILANALLYRLRARQSAALGFLRANRIQAKDLLARMGGPVVSPRPAGRGTSVT